MNYRPQAQMVLPLTKIVKYLIIANVGIWFVFQVIIEGLLFPNLDLTLYLGLVPQLVFLDFYVWQPFTYMFFHASGDIWHLVFNMFTLWWVGSELEAKWGAKPFLKYYLTCGVGAGVVYFIGVLIFAAITGQVQPLQIPVIGASGAIFGLMLAYGILFGERQLLFMMLFPIKARYFIMLLAAIEVSMLLTQGIGGGKVANLAHLGGIIVGFIYLTIWTRISQNKRNAGTGGGKKSRLTLIVNNDKNKPKYWN